MVTASTQQGIRTTPVVGWGIEQPEYDARVARVRRELERRELMRLVLFHPIRMAYLSGFFHYSTERPMAIVVGQDGGLGALVPHLEQDHIAKSPGVDRRQGLPRVPDRRHEAPAAHLADLLGGDGAERQGNAARLRLATATSISTATTARSGGDRAPDGVETVPARDIVDRLRAVKSEAELEFIKESCVWGNLAHRLMQEKLAAGPHRDGDRHRGLRRGQPDDDRRPRPHLPAVDGGFGSPAMVVFSAGANTALPHGCCRREGCGGATCSSPGPGPTSAATTRSWSGR